MRRTNGVDPRRADGGRKDGGGVYLVDYWNASSMEDRITGQSVPLEKTKSLTYYSFHRLSHDQKSSA